VKYSVLDLFAGCGGLGHGFKCNDNFQINLSNDKWEPARDTYVYNNPEIPFILDDIHNLNGDIFKKYYSNGVSVIIGGPPCQGFSMCGARDINDERNDLFYEYARIVSYTKPYIFIMENVKGLLSMKNKKGNLIINSIYEEFEKIGYKIQHTVINSKYYKVPQSRERVIIVGTRKDLPNNYIYPEPQLTENEVYTVEDALRDLPNENSLNGQILLNNQQNNEYYNTIKGDAKIYNHQIPTHKNEVEHRMSLVPQGGNWQNIPEEFRAGGIHSNAYRRLDLTRPSVTIKHAYKSMIIHPQYNRCLSIREVARLQSFPDDYIFKNTKTSQYQQLANAVPPNLSKALAESVIDYLTKNNLSSNNKQVDLNNFIDTECNEVKQLSIFDCV
jgi:DNA (cytosine-5)-methyltransferase 1